MYITTFNYAGTGNLIKRSQVTYFLQAAHLFDYMSRSKERFDNDLSQAFNEILEQKTEDLDRDLTTRKSNFDLNLESEKKAWFEDAQTKIDTIIANKVSEIESVVSNFTDQIAANLKRDLPNIVHDENVINLLIETLKKEVQDKAGALHLERLEQGDSIELRIENDDEVVSINTEEIILSLKKCLDTVSS